MIVSASYRTDIPAFYAAWFRRRFAAGFARVANPYGGPPSRVPLRAPEVDAFVFWTRNAEPFLPALEEVASAGLPFVVQFTITAYPRPLDAATIAPGRAVEQMAEIVDRWGPGRVVWRYDPLLLSSLTPARVHCEVFARLADALAGVVDEVVVSWLQVYRKTARNLGAAARRHKFSWNDPETDAKRALLADLALIAAARGMTFAVCGQSGLVVDGAREARCIDAERLSRLAGRAVPVPSRPHRQGCACVSSRDIGAYDSCPHGCVYCYAVAGRDAAKRRFSDHDPEGEFLIPPAERPG